jgi:uncharacterized protein (DUF111 family)
MKKGRPAHTLSVLVPMAAAGEVRAAVFRHTSTLGLRETTVRKRALDRAVRMVEVEGQPVRVKVGILPGGRVVTTQPEWEDVARLAARLNAPARRVLAAAQARAHEEAWIAPSESADAPVPADRPEDVAG